MDLKPGRIFNFVLQFIHRNICYNDEYEEFADHIKFTNLVNITLPLREAECLSFL